MLFVLKRFGVAHVTVTDLSPERLAFAERGGADLTAAAIDSVYDVVFDTVGSIRTGYS